MSFQEKSLECFDCNGTYTFTVEEQEQYRAKGYTNFPKRCPECRQARKTRRQGNHNNSYSTNNRSYTPQRQRFPAVCSECNKETEVPFEPREGRPVYCGDCYRKAKLSTFTPVR